MQKLFLVLALPCLTALGACERGDRDLDRDGFAERSSAHVDTPNDGRIDTPAENLAPKYDPKYGRGEGEKERSAGVLDNDGADKVPEATVVASYRSMIAEDPTLAAAAGNTRLLVEEGDLVLRGTVATRDLSDALEDLAKQIAEGREIDNELEVERR